MIWVLLIAAAIWTVGWVFEVPRVRSLILTAILLGAVVAIHATLPADNALVRGIGGTLGGWLVVIGAGAVAVAYARGVAALKARAPLLPKAEEGPFSDTELNRYARHIVLREIGGPGQMAMKNARVLVVGAGGLGSPALLYLAAAGVGTIGIVDDDVVDNSNLQRQVIHRDADIGKPKVFSAQAAMLAQNPAIVVQPYNRRLDEDSAEALIADYDIVLEGTDNFTTRYLVNRIAAKLGKPVIGGALSQWEGQISTFDPKRGAPCYQCIFPKAPAPGLAPSCSEAGVVGPLPGVIGAMMAVECVKEIAQAGEGLRGRMLIYDAMYSEVRVIKTKRREGCPVCG